MLIIGKYWLFFLSFGVAGYAVFVYGFLPLGSLVLPEMKVNFISHSTILYSHVFASTVALIFGPFQLSDRFRNKFKTIHRWMGRAYLSIGVLVGGLSGLYISQFAFGGIAARIGFTVLAVLWLYTGFRAFLSINSGAIEQHKKWMLRNFALTFAAVMLRIYLPISMVSGIEFTFAYSIIAWLSWVPNLLFVELFLNSKKSLKLQTHKILKGEQNV